MSEDRRSDKALMLEALALARQGVEEGAGGPFGAVVAGEGRVLGRGWNRVVADCDPTAHAEVTAIRDACATVESFDLTGATLYTTCKPCAMCLAAAHWARLDRIVFGAGPADAAAIGFDDLHIWEALTDDNGASSLPMRQLMRDQALEVFRQWQQSPLRVDY